MLASMLTLNLRHKLLRLCCLFVLLDQELPDEHLSLVCHDTAQRHLHMDTLRDRKRATYAPDLLILISAGCLYSVLLSAALHSILATVHRILFVCYCARDTLFLDSMAYFAQLVESRTVLDLSRRINCTLER